MDERSIMFDYQLALAQAGRLEGIAAQTVRSGESLAEAMNLTISGWQADSGALFRKKGARLEESMENSAAHLRVLAETVREIARRMYEAEMANLALVQERSYQ